MKSLIYVASIVGILVGAIATYFIARPKGFRMQDWQKVKDRSSDSWSAVIHQVSKAKAVVAGEPTVIEETRTA